MNCHRKGELKMKIAGSVLIFAVVSALMGYLTSASKKQISQAEDGTIVLKMNKLYEITGILVIIMAGAIGIWACFGIVKTVSDLILILLVIIVALCLSVPLVLTGRNQKVIVSEEKILYRGMAGREKEASWEDIKEVKFNKAALELKLITDTTSINLHMHLIGFDTFLQLMKRKLSLPMWGKAVTAIESVQKKY